MHMAHTGDKGTRRLMLCDRERASRVTIFDAESEQSDSFVMHGASRVTVL